MSHSLGGVTIHVDDKGFVDQQDSNYTFQDVLDATSEVISYYGAKSERISLTFWLIEDENSNTGNSTLKAAAKANADVNLTLDVGSLGNFRILTYKATRVMATNKTYPAYTVSAELVSTA